MTMLQMGLQIQIFMRSTLSLPLPSLNTLRGSEHPMPSERN